MNKIKVIDLLNMISKGEEVPKEIIYNGYNYFYHTDRKNYYRSVVGSNWIALTTDFSICNILNDEVEILEEEKKIPEKLDIRQEKNIKNNWKWKVYGKEHSYNISTPQKIIADKLNEVIDYLKSKGE